MKVREVAIFVAFMLIASFALSDSAYKIKAGDVIQISVWGEETLNQQTRVLPDGSISFPLVGSIQVSGQTAPDVEAAISERVHEYIPDPDVSVVVVAADGNRVFVIGKVGAPGAIVLTGPMTVMQALSQAGGLNTFANEDDIQILRNTEAGQTSLEVRYSDIMSGKDLSSNHQLEAGDTVLVP